MVFRGYFLYIVTSANSVYSRFGLSSYWPYLYIAHTMLCALHTYYPWSLDLFHSCTISTSFFIHIINNNKLLF